MEKTNLYREKIDEPALKDMYRLMWVIRNFEEGINILYQKRLAYGGMHLSVGQEAVAVGACRTLEAEDKIITSHRGHGHCIAKGADVDRMMAELMAKKTGLCKGKGGSQHIVELSKGILGAQGIVAAGIPIATGSALASKVQGKNYVTLCFFGDGATNNGGFHEGINMAAAFKLPVVFICENNGYAVTTSFERTANIKRVSDRACAYGIPGVTIDGNNVFDVYDAVNKAVELAKNGNGPSLIECTTYRWHGHYVGDPQLYRTKEEVDEWKEKDPILRFENLLLEAKICTHEEIEGLKNEATKIIEDALEFGMQSPEPGPEELFEDVYYTKEAGN